MPSRWPEWSMIELIQHYGLWVLLAAVFIAMYWFGESMCAGEQSRKRSGAVDTSAVPAAGIQSALGFLRRLFGLKIER